MSTLLAIDGKPPRFITLYVPVTLALLAGLLFRSDCVRSWPACVGETVLIIFFSFLLLWPVVLAFYHGLCFVRSLLQRRPSSTPVA